jgi:hypothetical protein
VFTQHAGWCWDASGSNIKLSGEGLVATNTRDDSYRVATCSKKPMAEGQHYWEVEVSERVIYNESHGRNSRSNIMFGAVRPGVDHGVTNGSLHLKNTGYFLDERNQGYGRVACGFAAGDRIGCLLNFDEGWLRFYCNGCALSKITCIKGGPLLRAVAMHGYGDVVTALPGAEAPMNIDSGDAVSVDYSLERYSSHQLKAACKETGLKATGTKHELRARLDAVAQQQWATRAGAGGGDIGGGDSRGDSGGGDGAGGGGGGGGSFKRHATARDSGSDDSDTAPAAGKCSAGCGFFAGPAGVCSQCDPNRGTVPVKSQKQRMPSRSARSGLQFDVDSATATRE